MVATLSNDNPDLIVHLAENIGNGVTLLNDTADEPPLAVVRPSGDELGKSGVKAYQDRGTVYVFDADTGYTDPADAQRIQVTFTSDVSGTVRVGWRFLILVDSPNLYGRMTSGYSTSLALRARHVRTRLNGTDGLYVVPYGTPQQDHPLRCNVNEPNTFVEGWAGATQAANAATTFTVNVGSNTIELSNSVSAHGKGFVAAACYVHLVTEDMNSRPRRPSNRLSATYDSGTIKNELAGARTARKRILFMGDSFAVRDGSWTRHFYSQITSRVPQGGVCQRVANGGSGNGIDYGASGAGQWTNSMDYAAGIAVTGGGLSGDATLQAGSANYDWENVETGSITVTPAAGIDELEVIYRTQAGGGDFTWELNGGGTNTINTVGSDGYAKVTISDSGLGGGSLVLDKSGAGPVEIASVVSLADTNRGLIAARLSQSGAGMDEHFSSTRLGLLEDYVTQFAPDIIVYGSVNDRVGSTADFDMELHFKMFHDALAQIADASNAKICLCELSRFTTAGYTITGGNFPALLNPLGEFFASIESLQIGGYLPRDISLLSFPRTLPGTYEGEIEHLHGLSFYDTQDATSIGDFHPSVSGGQLLGETLGRMARPFLPSQHVRQATGLAIG